MTATVQEVARNAEEASSVRDVADQSAEAAREAASSTARLALLGGELQTLIGRYKV